MAKKKTTKKKITKKVTEFDLDIKSKEQAAELVACMMQLQVSSGWLLLKQIMLGNVAFLEAAIIDRVNPEDKSKLSEEALDEARQKRAIMLEMIGKPETLIEKFKVHSGVEIPEYDPYYTDMSHFGKK